MKRPEYLVGGILLIVVAIGTSILFTLPDNDSDISISDGAPYVEIVDPAGFVNTPEIQVADFIGQEIVLIDFLTYSCINCQRTFPYLTAWHEEYGDKGLKIIGIHTPEFAFEKDIKNVEKAMERFGIKYPIVLDNDYATWRAFDNHYWPRKYLIDIHGNIVYDHIGEGGYEETEAKIRELLEERATFLEMEEASLPQELATASIIETKTTSRSPETYFGSNRNEYLANGKQGISGEFELQAPKVIESNLLYLAGDWDIQPEYSESRNGSRIIYKYNAKEVYLVADADQPVDLEIFQDGKPVQLERGADVNKDGIVTVQESQLYKIISNPAQESHILEIRSLGDGMRAYAFTFG